MKERKEIPIIYPPGSVLRADQERIITDPFGSYTGLTSNPDEKPVQDVDDL